MPRILFLLIVVLLVSGCNQDDRPITLTEDTPLEESAAYIFGYSEGLRARQQIAIMDELPIGLNPELIRSGYAVGLRGDSLNLSEEEADSVIFYFNEQFSIALAEREEQMAEDNLELGRKFLDQYDADHDDVEVTESGLRFRTITPGEGPTPQIQESVTIHYHGTLPSGEVFDSSRERGEPTRFPVGGVVPGFIEGLMKMQAGGQYEIVLPHDTAYGSQSRPGIGPNSTLKFEVEVLEIHPAE